MVTLPLTLDYTLPSGWLKPWVDAVFEGRALARRCAACHRVSFAPLRQCDCGERDGVWIELPGTAQIHFRTEGVDGSFALARFDGADTLATAILKNVPEDQDRVTIIPSPRRDIPVVALAPVGAG